MITHLFLDIGGVLLTNGWDHNSRKLASKQFKLDWEEMEERHHIVFESFEIGKFTLDAYLNMVVFFKPRPFTKSQFRAFMQAQSQPFPQMLQLMRELKAEHGLKITVVSNEGRELNAYRIQKFKLNQFVDAFVSSSFVGLRKPDPQIFQFALDISQAKPKQVVYVENTELFAQIAESCGIPTILHKDYPSTKAKLQAYLA